MFGFRRYLGMNQLVLAAIVFLLPVCLRAQVSPDSINPNGAPGWKGNSTEPCWKQVGISPAVMQKEKMVKKAAESEIQTVCADTSLSERQRKDKLRQIQVATHRQLAGLITPEQQLQLETCRAAQRREHPTPMSGTPHRNPCALSSPKVAAPTSPPPAATQEKPATEPSK